MESTICSNSRESGRCGVEAKSETSKDIKEAQEHLDQNVLARYAAIASASLLASWAASCPAARMARSAPTPSFGANLALENRDQRRKPKIEAFSAPSSGIVKLLKTRLTDPQDDGLVSCREPGMLGVGQLAFRQLDSTALRDQRR